MLGSWDTKKQASPPFIVALSASYLCRMLSVWFGRIHIWVAEKAICAQDNFLKNVWITHYFMNHIKICTLEAWGEQDRYVRYVRWFILQQVIAKCKVSFQCHKDKVLKWKQICTDKYDINITMNGANNALWWISNIFITCHPLHWIYSQQITCLIIRMQ